jgi:hypothetical protein
VIELDLKVRRLVANFNFPLSLKKINLHSTTFKSEMFNTK